MSSPAIPAIPAIPYSIQKNVFTLPRSSVAYVANNLFTIRGQERDLFERYYILYWSTDYLLSKIYNGAIIDQDTVYNVIYHRCTYGDIRRHRGTGTQIALSFRVPDGKFQLPPTVLLRAGEI